MALENQLLTFAQSQLEVVNSNWHSKQMSDNYAYTNGFAAHYHEQIKFWEHVCGFINERYFPADRELYTPATRQELLQALAIATKTANDHQAYYDSMLEEKGSAASDIYSYWWNEAIRQRQLANYFAYLLNIGHIFPGVDMLPASIDAAA